MPKKKLDYYKYYYTRSKFRIKDILDYYFKWYDKFEGNQKRAHMAYNQVYMKYRISKTSLYLYLKKYTSPKPKKRVKL